MLYLSTLIITLSIAIRLSSTRNCPHFSQNRLPSQAQLLKLSPECFSKLYDSQKHNGDKLSQLINQRLSIYKKLLQQVESNSFKEVKAEPVIKWAQSKQQIFINFKLSHRHDSPNCADIKSQDFQVVDIPLIECPFQIKIKSTKPKLITFESHESHNNAQNNTNTQNMQEKEEILTFFTYQGQCILSQQRLLFNLNMTFNDTVNRISIRKEGIGSYTIVGYKQTPKIWLTPFTNQHNLSIWAEMRQKYKIDMDQYFRLLDERHDQQQNKLKKKRKRKNRPTQPQQPQNTHSRDDQKSLQTQQTNQTIEQIPIGQL